MSVKKNLLTAIKFILVSLLLFSIIYPLLLGGVGQLFADKAEGSIIYRNGEAVGSRLIGQNFESDSYFISRPSSINYDASISGSDNLAVSNPKLQQRLAVDLEEIEAKYDPENTAVPVDLITESASALDPHISPEAAYFQVDYLSQNTGLAESELNSLISEHTEGALLGLFGESRVNVLELNLALEEVLD
ncbi:K+-transporting ATPase ATPase C chain [Halanaerobium saccharolyticum]|uniref:Potassium-transporting ATPase KdpC subunit n=1 Tax=Halanaerobium saccharolyticum TaxID=43595 RepID=A0A4R7YV07_9FIRM|nr:potassium-transporting ATPase subunit KdpC [Halanaerobium saccharolyticum]RAK06488.1 K+-transporting ATPase ATPase C chain [Halanaerobium saccharolyticum]TDW01032.1 K+-transporting ATPase ATPase C chain [Halanaerobium saccharolyticum]TDX52613.1 K+-transporting ATPase ATPase C chain [Halanaerobium saccharolyticum]